MRETTCDVAVIGAGSAGIAAHRAARGTGARALLIEAGPGGTTCARVGCMPSKLLAAAASAAHDARNTGLFGIEVPDVRVDGRAVLGRLRRERDHFVRGVLDNLDHLPGEERLCGYARFVDGRTLAVDDDRLVRFKAAVIATGSSPGIPGSLAAVRERVLTTDTLFEIEELPASLAVIGAGAVGIELAQAMARLGVETSVFEVGSSVAGLHEPSLLAEAADAFSHDVRLYLGTRVVEAYPEGAGVRLHWQNPDGGVADGVFARVLAAAGRTPNLSGLGLGKAGLRLDEQGVPRFEARSLLCEGAPVFIAGDADTLRPVLHEAVRQGRIAGENAAALAASGPLVAPTPWPALAMVFTDPEAATVGAAYDPDPGDGRLTGAMSFRDQGRARITGRVAGGVRVWADRSGRLLGGEMLGAGVEHLAHGLAHAVGDGLTVKDLRARPYYHPTLEEGLDGALADIVHRLG